MKNDNDLVEISKLMRTQHNRHTQRPLWVIQEVVRVQVSRENDYDVKERLDPDWGDFAMCEECEKIAENGGEIPQDCDECPDSSFLFYKEEYQTAYQSAGVFFTEKACEEHIEEFSYRFNKPRSYVTSAYNNDEMAAVMHYILSLTDGGIPSCYL